MRLGDSQNQPDSISCVPTATSIGVDQATAGKKKPSVHALRAAEGDFSGGMSYLQMTDATEKVAGVQSKAMYDVSTTNAHAIVEAGHPTVWSIDTTVTAPYAAVRTGTFRGGHSIHVPGGAGIVFEPDGDYCPCEKHIKTRHGEYTYEDPGTYSVHYRRISAELLHRAAKVRGGYADGGVNLLVLPDVAYVKRKVTKAGYLRRGAPSTAAHSSARVDVGQVVTLKQPVKGQRWRRSDGTYTDGWWELIDGRFIRADMVGVTNVA